jgi:hypothetical protein
MLVWMWQKKEPLIHCLWECKLVQQLWHTVWRLLKKLEIYVTYNLAILLLGMCPKEWESNYSNGFCMPIFTAALFTIAKLWKLPICPTTDKWIKKMWHLYTIKFYSATKNDIFSFRGKWMKLENIILSEVSQSQKTEFTCSTSYVDYSPKTHTEILWDTHHTEGRLCTEW